MTREDKIYSLFTEITEDKFSEYTKWKKKKIAKDTLIGAGAGAATGAGLGILGKGIHNKIKGEKFFKGTGKAALIGGGTGAVIGGVLSNRSAKKHNLKNESTAATTFGLGEPHEKWDARRKIDSRELLESKNTEFFRVGKDLHMRNTKFPTGDGRGTIVKEGKISHTPIHERLVSKIRNKLRK